MMVRRSLIAAVMSVLPTICVLGQEAAVVQPVVDAKAQADVPVRLVVLYSSGVGYFEHHGTVTGNASTVLQFKTQQINDLLKSLVLQDLDKGSVNAITYPSLDPLAKLLKSFQVDVSQNLSRADLLKQLRGAKVTCQLTAGKALAGTIVGVEIEKVPTGEKGDLQEIPVLNLLNENGVANVRLPEVSYVSFEDKRLQDELNKALAALAQARDQDKKAVTISFAGEGNRRVKIGYVIETPVWKTSYRLLLDDAPEKKPLIQGWAIIENQTDTDWSNVQLSLVSGRPISFVQDLYQPLYIPRPVVQPELYASLRPQEYQEGMFEREQLKEAAEAPAQSMAATGGRARLADLRQELAGRPMRKAGIEALARTDMPVTSEAASMLSLGEIASAASATKLGELFQYTVGVPVSLPRQKSAMLPIIADDITAQRVSIYNAGTLAKYPLNGAILTNSTGKHLLNGPITVIDNGSYGGDARISDLPPGQQRLISYGIDLKVLVDSTSTKFDQTITDGKIVKGVLQLARKQLYTQQYKLENKADREKTLIIEHPRRANWKLLTPEKTFETTDELYRFKIAAAAGKPTALQVQEQITQWESLAILPFDLNTLTLHIRNTQIPQKVRDALAEAARLKQAVAETQRQMDQTRQSINEASQAQQRTRENMKAIGQQAQSGDYYNRLLKRMADQDAQMDGLQKRLDDLQQELNRRQKELEDYVNNLNV